MHSCDILGYTTIDGEILCDDCGDENDEDLHPTFAENSTDLHGATCCECQSYFEPLEESWIDKDYARSKNLVWARCSNCGHQLGYDKHSRNFDDTKKLAKKNQLTCDSCRKNTMQFEKKKN